MHRRGGVLAAVAVAVLVVAVLAAVALVGTGMYVARNIRVTKTDGRHQQVTVETPFGSMRVRHGKADPRLLGLPVYPGAVLKDDDRKQASFQIDMGDDHREFAVVGAEYVTPDPVRKVREFYQRELPHWMISEKHHGDFQMEFTEGGYKKIIVIHERDGETTIGLASIGEPAAN